MRQFKAITATLFLFLTIISCKVGKTTSVEENHIDTVYIDKIRTDTLIKRVVVHKTVRQEYSESFNPCDSLGYVKPTDIRYRTKYVTVTVKDTLGKLQFTVLTDSIKQVYEKTYQAKYESDVEKYISEHKKISKTKIIVEKWSKYTWVFLLCSVLLLLILLSRLKKFFPTLI